MVEHTMRSSILGVSARLLIVLCSLIPVSCGESDMGVAFETISPEEAGFSREKLKAVEKHLERAGSAAFLALHDGRMFFSWGNLHRKYPAHSIRKAFLNSLYGIYVEQGVIDTSLTLAELGIDDIPPRLTKEEKQARVADLLRSRSGVYHPAAAEAAVMIHDRPERGSHRPGAFFYYNNWDFNVLGTIFEMETGRDIFEAFEGEIARPLGMKDFRAGDGQDRYESEKSDHPAYHFWITAHDMGLFGLLYERNGKWNGRRLVPEAWIRETTRVHSVINRDVGVGYGCLWYAFLEEADLGPGFFHTGAGIHMLGILPDLDLVFVHRVDTEKENVRFTGGDLLTLLDLFLAAREDT